jgi:hypothetical protein
MAMVAKGSNNQPFHTLNPIFLFVHMLKRTMPSEKALWALHDWSLDEIGGRVTVMIKRAILLGL